MNNTDRNNLAVFYSMRPYLATLTSSKVGIPSEIRRVQKKDFKNKEDFEKMFHDRFTFLNKQFQEFRTNIEVIRKTQTQNNMYNFELINLIYKMILSILETLEKLKSVKVKSDDFNPKDIHYSEMALLRELLDKLNDLKKVKFKEVFHGNWTNVKMFGGMLNPLNWIKKS